MYQDIRALFASKKTSFSTRIPGGAIGESIKVPLVFDAPQTVFETFGCYLAVT